MFLPQPFLAKMKALLGNELEKFLDSFTESRYAGFRANLLKISAEDLMTLVPYGNKVCIPWCNSGFYYNETKERPAKNPLYYAGLYYIQEPSAMKPAEVLAVKPGEIVLDLCAAPGGKSTQLASQLNRTGLLVVNDNNFGRAKVLLKNMERYGVINCIVLNETPERIKKVFPNFFDKILIDAPCSGEGMFRKQPEMAKEWSEDEVLKYATWQKEILADASELLKSSGEMVYSTCTFSTEENEQQIKGFIEKNPGFKIVSEVRLWPHKIKGEGHFLAKIKRGNEEAQSNVTKLSIVKSKGINAFTDFVEMLWKTRDVSILLPSEGVLVERNGHILWESSLIPELRGLKVLRSGWLLGTYEKNRFKPSQAFVMGLDVDMIKQCTYIQNFSSKNEKELLNAIKYLKGDTIQIDDKEWVNKYYIVTIDGFALGWAKGNQNILKNEYPPGWRWED